ncbi:hypothetical protein Ndes2526B_g07033 [Nannochloris sp. 'desiccata']|nr:hypothetical protein KSW81_004897 [Chlorella desiccata (nom. nud.)]KAH7618123.1 putative Blue-light photoreceptor PHR2 [Chlorella desiccata (nom. nud.)]
MYPVSVAHAPSAPKVSVVHRAAALARGAGNSLARLTSWRKLKFSLLIGADAARSRSATSRSGSNVSLYPLGASPSHSERPGAPAGRKPGIVWFRSDLRLDDNEALNKANAECSSVLPVYCFDPRDYSRSPQGYDRTGPYRAAFLLQAVSDLRTRLQASGSDLIIRMGHPEEIVAELARCVGASSVYCHSEVTYEEKQVEKRVTESIKSAGAQLKSFWTNTLHGMDDLPFKLAEMPQNFDKFRVRMAGTKPKVALSAPEQLKGLPVGAGQQLLDNGKIPTLKDLGLKPLNKNMTTSTSSSLSSLINNPTGSFASDNACLGGETEALKQLKRFLSIASSASSGRGGVGKSSSGAVAVAHGAANASSFSSSVAPWLATGCLSPRRMLEEAHKMLDGKTAGDGEGVQTTAAGSSLQWVQFELLWRDFFRLLTKRHSEVVLPRAIDAVAAAQAATPAFAMA